MSSDLPVGTDQFISVPGGHVFVRSWIPLKDGAGLDLAPVLLLHDSLGCVETWRDFPARLCERLQRRVIAYDRLGFGRSSARIARPSDRFIAEEGETQVPAVLDAVGVSRAVLFGHSVGGSMAVAAAAYRPECVESVVVESSQPFVEERTLEGIRAAQKNFADPQMFARLAKYHGEKTSWVLDAWIGVWTSAAYADWTLREELNRVKCPLLVLHGDQDEFGSYAFPEMIARESGGRKVLLDGTGHVPHREKPEMILDLVADFLK